MHAALRVLRDLDAAGCVVLGEPAFYSRFGFQPDPGLVLAGAPREYFQAISFGPRQPRGTVTYHAAFAVREPPEGRG
jgi:putative acetyltransferase